MKHSFEWLTQQFSFLCTGTQFVTLQKTFAMQLLAKCAIT